MGVVHFWCKFLGIKKTYKVEIQHLVGSLLRRERDSNPRSLSAQRFSRPPQSTTLPSLLRRNWLARRNSICEFGLPPMLLLTRAHEALVIFLSCDFFKSGAKVLLFFQIHKFFIKILANMRKI